MSDTEFTSGRMGTSMDEFDRLYHWISSILERSRSEQVAFFMGLGLGFILLIPKLLLHRIHRWWTKQELSAPPDQRIAELTETLESKSEEILKLTDQANTLQEENSEYEGELKQLNFQLEKLTQLDGNVWQRPPDHAQIPIFKPLSSGRPPIIAVVNLKGGVGKTTLTANLAAASLQMGLIPLLVDLDYQNSLSGLALKPQLRKDISDRDQVVRTLIDSSNPTGADVIKLMQRIGDQNGFILATDELLTEVETKVMARWITDSTEDDVRYRLRNALHDDAVKDQCDLILIDCPPRITTTCVNALTCCDYVLIPALLDSLSLEAVPRLLTWLKTFKHENQICPNMSILGVVGNRAQNSKGMSSKQLRVWNDLDGLCRNSWGESVHLFETCVPDSVSFADAANSNCFAADSDKLRPIFLDLISEIQKRIPLHASQRSSAISR